jgi:hypothetical protein
VRSAIKPLRSTDLILVILLHWAIEAKVHTLVLGDPHLTSDGLVLTAIVQAVHLWTTMLGEAPESVLFEVITHLTDFYFVLHQLLLDLCLHVKFGGCVVITAEDLRLVGLGTRVVGLMQVTLDNFL